ncbi:MAG: glycosyltransferase family 2 protein [Acidobacteriota bacterium]|jgi:NDP-sugar pyrophosphorylase family protein|nr:glycosyltransferase family 2 protein [Acidobacteriota bacterium]
MLNIVIPMAGRGSRFAEVGYTLPKPLIPVHGAPMIRLVLENLRPATPHRFIFLCLREHVKAWRIDEKLRRWAPGCEIVFVDKVTEGAACTVLLAKELIDDANPLMIANSDQWADVAIDSYLEAMERDDLDGLIMTMQADDPKWSFVRLDSRGFVTEVVEKQVISHDATVGIYNFRCGADFVRAAEAMIAENRRVNGEFYVAPVYNELIREGARVKPYSIGGVNSGMYGMGIPRDLESFLALPISLAATQGLQEIAQ